MLVRVVEQLPSSHRYPASPDGAGWRQAGATTDKLDCGNPSHLQNLTRFVITCVAKPVTGNLFGRVYIAKRSNVSPTGSNGWFLGNGSSTGGLSFRWRRATTNLEYSGAANGAVPLDTWNRFVVIVDQTASQIVRAWSDPALMGSWREVVFSTQTAGAGSYNSDAALNLVVGNLTSGANGSLAGDIGHVGLWKYENQPLETLLDLCENPFAYEREALLCLFPGERGGTATPRDHSRYNVTVTRTNGQAVSGARRLWMRAYRPLFVDGARVAAGGLTTVTLAGSLSPSGGLIRKTTRALTGGVTPAGTLSTLKVAIVALAGGLVPAGSLIRRTTKLLSAGLTPAGSLLKSITKRLAGGLTPSGALTTLKVIILSLGGALTSSGAIIRRTTKLLMGTTTPAGAVVKRTTRLLTGGLTPAGAVTKRLTRLLGGNLTPTGALVTQLISGGARLMRLVAGVTVEPLYSVGVRLRTALRAGTRTRPRSSGRPDISPED